MNILAIGDVCGSIGCNALTKLLPDVKKRYNIDFTVVNGENSADGNGITPKSAESIFSCGADVITGGNHTMRRREVHSLLDTNEYLLRPQNINAKYGSGYALIDFGKLSLAVINLSGQVYLDALSPSSPFDAADELINKAKQDSAKIIIVDFHAEATSEKRALAFYLDGKVSAFFGTHTHVLTADNQILPKGTGYITDIGMTGPVNSVLGVKSDIIISRFKGDFTQKFKIADGKCMLNGCVFSVNEKTGLCENTEIININ